MISGAHEFFADAPVAFSRNTNDENATSRRTSAPDTPPTGFTPERLRQAYALLQVDVGYATPRTAEWFGSAGLPRGFSAVSTAPVTRRVSVGGVRVAVTLFPPMTAATAEKTVRTLLDAALDARDADMVVGVAPWGFRLEGTWLAALSEGYDVLLGSGEGAPFTAEVTTYAPGIVWSRGDRDARSVTELSFLTLPGPGAERPRAWMPGVDVLAREHALGEHIADHPGVAALLPPKP